MLALLRVTKKLFIYYLIIFKKYGALLLRISCMLLCFVFKFTLTNPGYMVKFNPELTPRLRYRASLAPGLLQCGVRNAQTSEETLGHR